MAFFGLFGKEKKEDLNKGLEKTKEGFFSKLAKTIAGKSTVDDEVLDNLEDALVSSDVGVETTVKIIKNIEARVARDKYLSSSELERILREEVELIMKQASAPATAVDYQLPAGSRPHVIMVVGVNGVGKTTTIGKMAYQFKAKGYQVMLGAADTFRAAAVDQLTIWSDRAGVEIVKQGQGADPAAVAFDAVQSAKARGADVCIIDTAGRLHNKVGLMNELSKIKRVMQKVVPDAPHEVLLVLDASTGQNAIEQAKQFTAATEVTAIALTKLDGTAKGGVVIGIADQFKIPVKYIGVGEKMHQLQLFDSAEFIDSLFDKTGFKI
ncbi:signal recognition particle receptor FtsY [Bacteroidota bacterium]|nr:signal recognition particle receptor FtsY [Bacteroidota bacterium]